ncbi:MAG TPA: hypothetical protein VFD73_03775, partial [Gemmatimonadales bacterium]|nr:hypothetical protein [Gemmatimonadales bacterium]
MRVSRLSFIVVALAACSERTDQLRSDLDAAAAPLVRPAALRVSTEPVLVRSSETAVPHLSSDTLPWTDSAVRGDTTLLTRGRAITTTSVVTDSQWIHVAAPPRQKG